MAKRFNMIVKETKSSFLSLSLPDKRQIGKVHSVFATSLNIMVNNQLINFSQEGMSLSAHGCILGKKKMGTLLELCRPKDIVKVENDKITFYTKQGVESVDLSDFTEMDLSLTKINIADQSIAGTSVFQSLKAVSFEEEIGIACDGKAKAVFDILNNIATSSEEEKNKAVTFLIGRGKGLTPSGDDILSGFIMIRKSFLEKDNFQEYVKEKLKVQKTTDISEAYYNALFSGYVSSLFLTFLSAFETNETLNTNQLIKLIGKYGHTSGYDTLLGMYLGLQSLINEMEE
ncbi:MAG: DUF2877 domain-containing protein [Alkalibacterium sp.]|uniref:DUF2877 domain-containing protein n=1 Tax=Alkalibacterium gilvum TaxID=1130080 RepID=A0A1H6U8Q2_9LACT|nr:MULTISPECIES: DUF2877 domain-containing protein [Alkalibacterium]MDN6193539.1 DUF2877 domain-containing protein [Alkalibacterium sp.]MDN6293332.1 DUF2877 domain-containing protein [Alkalibacterium sp.]MDN6294917.1 DUF2877 domain-containing protein [Alkalibacterium sp.]MDN6326689.1 DUF2877 domain-containing protein [Alkalibacterium sp.]MDN6397799.1 DUF2877 domain-containing protein [Alkalibacterium sp.]